jgi:hypothetical protein
MRHALVATIAILVGAVLMLQSSPLPVASITLGALLLWMAIYRGGLRS